MEAIRTEGLTKVYGRGRAPAVEDLNLTVDQGELFGFLGPNGAGKTTTIRILMTLLRPTRGRCWVSGFDVSEEPLQAMRQVGFMPESPGFYSTLTGRQHLNYYASLYGQKLSHDDGKIDELLTKVGLAEASDKKAKAYSMGMKRRLALAGALVASPKMLVLDEPSLGLDPGGMAFVRSLLRELHGDGNTIFLSSHLLSEVEKICTKVGVLNRGRLLRVDSPKALVKAIGGVGSGLEVGTRGVESTTLRDLEGIPGVEGVQMEGNLLRIYGSLDDDAVAEVNKRLISSGVAILSSRRVEADLEQAFLALTGGEG